MERLMKQDGGYAHSQRTAQAKSRDGELADGIANSPTMVAQRKQLQSLFGGAIQRQEPMGGMPHGKAGKQTNKHGVIQKFDPNKTPRSSLNASGKWAYDLLINDRAEFKKIDKSGGDVNAVQDSKKRVTWASKHIDSKAAPRNQALQTGIGWLGNLEAEDTGAGYNGGHLIASSLGGSGTWQNMVPQDGPENKWGDWRQYEKENAAAFKETGEPLKVSVSLGYSGDSVLPTSWDSWLTDKNGKDVNWYSGLF
jgi:hypothetical protein